MLLPSLTRAFAAIELAVEELETRKSAKRGRLMIGASPGFGSHWLLPRLNAFHELYPHIELQLATRTTMSDSVLRVSENPDDWFQGCDVAIRFGAGAYRGCVARKLFSMASTPICHPALLDGRHPLRAPDDLRHHTLLHVRNDVAQMDTGWPGWRDWLKAAGVDDIDPRKGPVFNQISLAIEAAADQMGVVLAAPLLAARELSRGRLAVPFSLSLTMRSVYSIVHPLHPSPEVEAFCNWLLAEAAAEVWAKPMGGLEPLRWMPL